MRFLHYFLIHSKDELGKDVKVLSKELTEDLQNKMKDIHQKFNDYILNNAAAASEVQMVYNDTYNGTVARDFTEMGKLTPNYQILPLNGMNDYMSINDLV